MSGVAEFLSLSVLYADDIQRCSDGFVVPVTFEFEQDAERFCRMVELCREFNHREADNLADERTDP